MSTESTQQMAEDATLRAEIDRSLRHPVMFFFTSGAAWLAVSLLLGIIATAKSFAPGFLSCVDCLTYGRTFAAHMNVLLYGWCAQAAFGTMIWLMSRLSRQPSQSSGVILTVGHAWNAVIALGTIGILSGNGSGQPWMGFPNFVWPCLIVLYAAIAIWSVIQFRVRRGGHVFISQWYILAALFWFPWTLLTAHVFIHVIGDGHPVFATAINAWFRSGLLFLFFTPIAIASAYYLAPKVTGRPVYSYSLALFGFWALAVVGPWAGMQKLYGAPIPVWLQYAGAGATILLLIPAIAVSVNILKTVSAKGETVAHSPSLRFSVAGIIGLAATALFAAALALPGSMSLTQFSIASYGFDIFALYGFFSMCMFGAIYFIVPRITGREWISTKFIRVHFWSSIYGVVFIALFCGLLGGYLQGQAVENFSEPFASAMGRYKIYTIGMAIGWVFVLLANFFFCFHLLLMWLRLGRRSNHPTLLKHNAHGQVHGPEGDLDSLQSPTS